jgi:hypothetical protein
MDETVLISLILSICSMMSNVVLHYKLRHCHSVCCDSDCVNSQPNTPTNEYLRENEKLTVKDF